MKLEHEPPQPAGILEFSGKKETYDDGVFRISLPAELIPEVLEDTLSFGLDGFPFRIFWTTAVLEGPDLETLDCPSETLEDVMRFFLSDYSPEDPLRPVFLANGFYLVSQACIREGECRNCCLLVNFSDDDEVVLSSLEVAAPEEWQNDLNLVFLLHLLKKFIRSARCSLGESTINTSKALLHVPQIGIRFPLMLASMVYRFATDYEPQAAGQDISLRYADEDGRRADLYIFDFGQELIEPGAETDQVREQMDAVIEQIEPLYEPAVPEFQEKRVILFGREEMAFLVRRLLLAGTEPGEAPLVTAILLAARRGVFIKVRFTPLPGETEPQHPLLDRFMHDLADVLVA